MRRYCLPVAGVLIFMAAGCGESKKVDVDTDMMLGGLSSQDFRSVCFTMSQSLVRLPRIQKAASPPRVAFARVTNKSNEIIDTRSFLEKMRTELIKNAGGKIVFLERQNLKQIMDEQDMKLMSGAGAAGGTKPFGADYLLAGTITGITRARGRESTSYMRLAFRLTGTGTGVIIWEDDYEMKYYRKAGVYDR